MINKNLDWLLTSSDHLSQSHPINQLEGGDSDSDTDNDGIDTSYEEGLSRKDRIKAKTKRINIKKKKKEYTKKTNK